MPVPRENDRSFGRRMNIKKTARFRLPNSRRVPWAALRNYLNLKVLAMKKRARDKEKHMAKGPMRFRRRKNRRVSGKETELQAAH